MLPPTDASSVQAAHGHGSTLGHQDCGKACNDHSDCSGGCSFCSGPGGKCEEGHTAPTVEAPDAVPGRAFKKYLEPLQLLAIRGMFWSHGSSDAAPASRSRGVEGVQEGYESCFQASASSWRDGGNIGDWSIAYSQLSPLAGPSAASVFAIQQAQNGGQPHPGLQGLTTTSMAPFTGLRTGKWNRVELNEAGRRIALGMLHTAFTKMSPWLDWSPPKWINASMGDQEVHGSGSVLSVVLTFLATPGYNSLKFPNNCEALLGLSADNGASCIRAISAHLESVDTRTETVPLVATFPSTKERSHREEAPLSMLASAVWL